MKIFDSVGDTTLSSGLTTLTGTGTPPTGYQSFAQAGVADQENLVVRCETKNKSVWEVFETVYTVSSKQYTRGTTLASSNNNNPVNFPTGTKNIYIVLASEELAQRVLTNQGDLLTLNSSGKLVRIAAGTSGQVLTSNGVNTLPTYQAIGGGGTDTPYIYGGVNLLGTFQKFVPALLGLADLNSSAYPNPFDFTGGTRIPFNAILSNLYFDGDRNSDGTDEMDIYINGTITNIRAIVANGVKSGNDLTHTAIANAGDYISVYYTGGGNFNVWSFAFLATKTS